MNNNTDSQTAPVTSPISWYFNEPGSCWTPALDLAEYPRCRSVYEFAPDFPAQATREEAYADVLHLLKSADISLGISLATWATYNAGGRDTQSVHALRVLPRPKLVARFLRVGREMAASISDRKGCADFQEHIAELAQRALELEESREQLMDDHASKPGSVSLCGLFYLTNDHLLLDCELVEDYWPAKEPVVLYSQAMDEVPGYWFNRFDFFTNP